MNETVAFTLFSAIALLGGLNVVLRRNPVHCALYLVVAFLGIAGLFLTMGSGVLAAIQVMVYAGAIMVLFLFVILLLNLEHTAFEGVSLARGASALVAVATAALILWPFVGVTDPTRTVPAGAAPATVENVGAALFQRYALPFEIVSLLLLVAMVGAIHLARRPDPEEAS